jgi:RNA polymerase sigma factor (sigma-70 family)
VEITIREEYEMASPQGSRVRPQFANQLATAEPLPLSDDQLLERYVNRRDQGAFALLVERYAGLVHGVCLRVLGDVHEADDAFQATFLVLVRRADELDRRGSLGSWLYGVAYRTALKARGRSVRRRIRERPVLDVADGKVNEETVWNDILPVLDEELNRLPAKYREPLVLCYLKGKTHQEAARELGWPSGSMSRRLERARELLRNSLVNRGMVVSLGLLVLLLTKKGTAAAPAALLTATTQAALSFGTGTGIAAAVPSTGTVALAEEVLRSLGTGPVLASSAGRGIAVVVAVLAILLLGGGGYGGYELYKVWKTPAMCPLPEGLVGAAPDTVKALTGHRRAVLAVAFSPDSKTLASGSLDPNDMIRVWDVTRSEEVKQLLGHKGAVTALAYAPNGKILASGSSDGTIKLWDPETGKERTLSGHPGGVHALVFAADGTLLASAGADRTIKLWDVATAHQRQTLKDTAGVPLSVAYSPRKGLLASGSDDGSVQLWDLVTGHVQATLKGHTGAVNAVSFATDGAALASGGVDQTVRLWDVDHQVPVQSCVGHSGAVRAIAFAPDGRRFASAGQDRTVRIWDVATGQMVTSMERHQGSINTLAWAPDGQKLASGSADQTIVLWQAKEIRAEK